MRSQSLLAVLATSLVGQVAAQDAKVNHDNPPGVIVKATLPDKAFSQVSLPQGGNAKGEITAMSAPDGKGVLFKVKFSNLPKDSFPFTYHLHVDPVPSDGNCTKTLAHLDPFARGEATDCDASKLASCQVGDLSGKYGKVTKDPYEAEYLDEYVSLKEGLGAYFGNRSFVLHFSNKTRISCANFEVKHGPPGGGHGEDDQCDHEDGAASGTGSLPAPTREPVPFVGGAAASSASMLGIFAAIMFAL